MTSKREESWKRRDVLGALAFAGTAGLVGQGSRAIAAEPPPETARLRPDRRPSICVSPQYVAEEFFRAEGFTDVQYVSLRGPKEFQSALAAGEVDIGLHFAAPTIIRIDAGDPIVVLAGGHVGCFELFGTDRVRAIPDLKGKTVAVFELGSSHHVFLASMAAYVGLDPVKDINWVVHPEDEAKRLLAEGRIDALLAFPPDAQELRAKKVGHVVVNSMMDRPWSQYLCCVVEANREFVRKNPVATKRALRAILKATNVCAREPERVARFLLDKGYTTNYDYALQTMREMRMAYGHSHEYDPEDTLRFYALRLHEAGMIRSGPQRIVAQGSDWRFLKELEKELKG